MQKFSFRRIACCQFVTIICDQLALICDQLATGNRGATTSSVPEEIRLNISVVKGRNVCLQGWRSMDHLSAQLVNFFHLSGLEFKTCPL